MTEAIIEPGRGKLLSYENGILLLLGFTFGLIFFDRNAVSVLTPFILQDLALSNAQLGMLSSGLALAWALSAYALSALSDKSGVRKPFLILSIVVFSLCSAASGLAASFAFLLMARIVMGIAEGPYLPIALSVMNVESSPTRRGVNAGILQNVFAALLGTSLAPVVLVALAESFNWRIAFYLTGVPGLICAFLVWRFMREPRAHPSDLPETEHKAGLIASLGMLKFHNVRICSLVSICMVAFFLVALTFLPVFLTQYRGLEPTQMGWLMGVMGMSTVFCGFLVPMWSDFIGRKPIMVIFCFMGMVTPLAALFFDGPLWMLAALLFVGWSATGAFPLFMGVIPGESVSPKLAGSAMGLVVCIGELIGGVGAPSLAGWFADLTSLQAPLYAIAALAFLGGALSLLLTETAPRKTQKA